MTFELVVRRIDEQPATLRPRNGAIYYEPLPADALAQLERLMRYAPNAEELEWLAEQAALVTAECETCPPRKPRKPVWFKRGKRS